MNLRSCLLVTLTSIIIALQGNSAFAQAKNPPRLILQITVDQLRGDFPARYYDSFGEGGFRYLMDKGTWYANTHHGHANNETIVGHVTLATGTHPARHGMIGNVWLDRESGNLTYNIEDSRYLIIGNKTLIDQETEIDPTQAVSRSDGRSPAAILTSTFSDELNLFYGGQSKIFSVSIKDRGAVSMAGHGGKAFWFSKPTGEFISSTFYYDAYPPWVTAWNEKRMVDTWDEKYWELERDRSTYLFGERDDRPYESDLAGFGRTFPHPFGSKSSKYYTTLLTISPAGDDLTLDFAKSMIEHEQLGLDDVPDYLAVSFSSTDYVGHMFGPSSLESEENILRLDETLADLIGFVDKKVGLENTLIVLSADHGAPEAPGYMNELGIEARYVDVDSWDRAPAMAALKKRFGLGEELIETYFHPYLYLNRGVIAEHGLDMAEVENAVAAEIEKFDGVTLAIPSTRLRNGEVPDTPTINAVLNNFNPLRSGDIYVVFEPHSFINDMEGLTVTSTHGSPWTYDSFVPLIFAGRDISAQRIVRPVGTVDVAATLSAIIGAKPPSGSVGIPLAEVMSR